MYNTLNKTGLANVEEIRQLFADNIKKTEFSKLGYISNVKLCPNETSLELKININGVVFFKHLDKLILDINEFEYFYVLDKYSLISSNEISIFIGVI